MRIARRALASSFGRFCVVGGLGFVTDTAALLGLVRFGGLPPVPAKVVSFGIAVLVTFQLNRMWAFAAVRHDRLGRAFATYVWVQSTGAACNLAIFAACNAVLPPGLIWLGISAVVASASALLVNYTGASRFVFLGRRRAGPPIKP